MSFSWWVTQPAKAGQWGTVRVPDRAVEKAKLPNTFIGGTARSEIVGIFGFDIRDGLPPDALKMLAAAIRKKASATHSCNCAYCGWSAPDLGSYIEAKEWIEIADLFDTIASKNWGIEGSY